ncbi:hypothetical protein V493_01957 [Pseudogymnoascus sp. VKM F-4281 (FW-2241)]|nr:hypothetical protein V493_01957 [Pseudogymnoascus sp. VKM F-4281 (FW-2241)]
MRLSVYLTPLLLCVAAASYPRKPTAVVNAGIIVGVTTSLPSSTVTVNKFLGIPYAQPPVGSKRFLPPIPLKRFKKSPLIANKWGKSCHQRNEAETDVANESEDCLFLNVYTPAECSKRKLPVLFWIYGGNLQDGNSGRQAFDGTSFATNHEIVVVTINYRVNVFGFPSSPALPLAKSNLGFLDQRLALEWVQKNIHAFNGDPKKVTIGGESSGGSSVDRLVDTFAPPLIPPFRAAAESSGQASVSPIERNLGPASWATLVSTLGCNGTSSKAELACMQAVDALEIRAVVTGSDLDWTAVTDGVTQVELPYLSSRAAGKAAQVPLYIGSSAQEGTTLARSYNLDMPSFSEEHLTYLLNTLTGGNETITGFFSNLVHSIVETDGLSLFYAAALSYTELVYQCPAKLVAQATAQSGLPAWRYYYNISFPNIYLNGDPDTYPKFGAWHTSDHGLIWGNYPTENATLIQVELSKKIQAAWAGFVKDPWGEGPGWDRVDENGNGLACFGCEGGADVTLIDQPHVDVRCPYYDMLYDATKTPYF